MEPKQEVKWYLSWMEVANWFDGCSNLERKCQSYLMGVPNTVLCTISECGKICYWWYWWIPGRWQPIEWGTFVPMECETNPSFYSKMVGVHHGQLFAGLWLLILYDPHCLPANFCFFKHEPLHRKLPHFIGAKRFGEPSFIAETELTFGQEISSFYRCKVVPSKLTQRVAEL